MSAQAVLEAKGIEKSFGETIALKGIDVTIYPGEVHGLVGENGSGKSTFSSITSGILKQDNGTLKLNGQPYQPNSMVDALNKGIGMIVQEEGTISGVTVAENMFLGELNQFRTFGILNKNKLFNEANKALENIRIDHIKGSQPIDSLDMQDRKLVEIAKVVYKDPQILIIDETSTALSYKGREVLYSIIEDFKKKNHSVILISHDLDELIDKCDKLTVLRDGKWIKDLNKEDFNEDYIKQLLVGRKLVGNFYRDDFEPTREDEVVLSVSDLSYNDKLKNIDLNLYKGEILGIGGLSHCGMHELGKIIFGFLNTDNGRVLTKDQIIGSEKGAMSNGLGYVSKNRDHEALSLDTPIKDNISIVALDQLKKGSFLFNKDERAYVQEQIDAFNIKTPSMDHKVSKLSGGNKQKVVFAKWVGRGSDILVLDCPTRGVDIGVKQAMYQLIIKLKNEGKSFVLISEELSELIGLSDRLLIMKDGEINKEFSRHKELSESDIITYMI